MAEGKVTKIDSGSSKEPVHVSLVGGGATITTIPHSVLTLEKAKTLSEGAVMSPDEEAISGKVVSLADLANAKLGKMKVGRWDLCSFLVLAFWNSLVLLPFSSLSIVLRLYPFPRTFFCSLLLTLGCQPTEMFLLCFINFPILPPPPPTRRCTVQAGWWWKWPAWSGMWTRAWRRPLWSMLWPSGSRGGGIV